MRREPFDYHKMSSDLDQDIKTLQERIAELGNPIDMAGRARKCFYEDWLIELKVKKRDLLKKAERREHETEYNYSERKKRCNVEFFTVGLLKSKSGLNVNHNITSEGVIDMGYTGSIRVKPYNQGTDDYHVKRGDKISQLAIMPILTPELEVVNELEETDRGENGFGSSGR